MTSPELPANQVIGTTISPPPTILMPQSLNLLFDHAHCVCQSPLVASIKITGTPTQTEYVSAWVGMGCDMASSRMITGTTIQQCRQVPIGAGPGASAGFVPVSNFVTSGSVPQTATLSTSDFLGAFINNEGCTAGLAAASFFIVITATPNAAAQTIQSQSLTVQTTRSGLPAPPTACANPPCATGGKDGAALSWTASPEDSTLLGYQAFCQSLPDDCSVPGVSPTSELLFQLPSDVCPGGVPPAGVDGGAPADAVAPDGARRDMAMATGDLSRLSTERGAAFCGPIAGAGGAATSGSEAFKCGTIGRGQTSMRIGGLVNGKMYRFFLAAIDEVGNLSVLTDLGTATATNSEDFYQGYRAAGGGADGGFCFVATAAYGDYNHPYVRVLRDLRDRVLAHHAPGRAFIAWYYRSSPPLADFIRRHPVARWTARVLLFPVVVAAGVVTYTSAWQKATLAAALLLAAGLVLLRRRRRAEARR